MKAVVVNKYGSADVLKVKEIAMPEPKPDEILVKIKATSVTAAHCAMRTGKPLFGRLFIGITKPKISIPGTDMAGEVVSVGSSVSKFAVGDEIIAVTDIAGGTYAEYLCISENDILAYKPQNISAAEATGMIDGAMTALSFLRESVSLKEGQEILINGASGSIGTSAVQLAKLMGATVTGVCSTNNVPMVKELGADYVVDYTQEDFTKSNKKYDIIFDTVGKLDFTTCKHSLKKNGKFLSPVLGLNILKDILVSNIRGNKKAIFSATGLRKANVKLPDLKYLASLLEQKKLKVVIDKKYSIDEIVDAHKYVDTGHKKGNVVIEF